MEPDEILDGLALWDEHKPQTGADWMGVATRSVQAKDYDPSVGAPMFQALYRAVAALMEIADGPERHDAVRSIKIAKRALGHRASPRKESDG